MGTTQVWVMSELPYPSRRAPRRFPVVRVGRERCGACLGMPVPVERGTPLLYRVVGVCALAPAAA